MSASAQPITPQPEVQNIDLLGVRVSAIDLEGAADRIVEAVARNERGYVCVCDAHGIVNCHADPSLRAIYNDAMLVTPDGMPLVWELRRRGHEISGRVYGPDLMRLVFGRGLRHFLYGATPETLAELVARLGREFPQAEIAGTFAPPFRALTEAEETEVVERIEAAAPDIVWVGLGAPKQERWMARLRPRLSAPVLIGVGAAFDFHAGKVRQAPPWVQSAGIEWAYRVASEPRRLGRRYLRVVPTYLTLMALQRVGVLPPPST